jgi:predicted  nucleic acid-binding Zn-ribbon protein
MHKSFFYLFFISLAGVLITALMGTHWQWVGLAAGLAPLVIYHFILYRKQSVSATEVDSIYYFGFLVTVVMLVAAALSIGLSESKLEIPKVLVQFSLGLVATGYALFSRLQLLTKLNTQIDVLDSTDKLAMSIERVAGEFDRAGYHVTAFVEVTQQRMTEMEHNFQLRSEAAANAFEEKLNASALAFNEATKDSLGKAYSVLEEAIENFTTAIASVSKDVARIQDESESISFVKAADRIDDFSKAMKSSIESITNEVSSASQSSVTAITELTASAKKTQILAEQIAKSLESLNKLEDLMLTIGNTSSALESISKSALDTGNSISTLGNKINHAEEDLRKHLAAPSIYSGLGEAIASLSQGMAVFESQAASLSKIMEEQHIPFDSALKSATNGLKSIGDQVSSLEEIGPSAIMVVQQLKAIAASASLMSDKISGIKETLPSESQPNVAISSMSLS